MDHPNNPHTVNVSHQGRNRSKILHLDECWENMPCMKRKVTKKVIEEKKNLLDPIWPFSYNNTKQWFRKVAQFQEFSWLALIELCLGGTHGSSGSPIIICKQCWMLILFRMLCINLSLKKFPCLPWPIKDIHSTRRVQNPPKVSAPLSLHLLFVADCVPNDHVWPSKITLGWEKNINEWRSEYWW